MVPGLCTRLRKGMAPGWHLNGDLEAVLPRQGIFANTKREIFVYVPPIPFELLPPFAMLGCEKVSPCCCPDGTP